MADPNRVATLLVIVAESEVLRTMAIAEGLDSVASLCEHVLREARTQLGKLGVTPPPDRRQSRDPEVLRRG
jgi:hypothetical protein